MINRHRKHRVPPTTARIVEITEEWVTITLPEYIVEMLRENMKAFAVKFGREMGPDDPMFFDPDADEPTPMTPERYEELIAQAGEAAGIPDAVERLRATVEQRRSEMGWPTDDER